MGQTSAGEAAIRPATAADVPAVLELWSRARSVAASLPDNRAAVEALLERDSSSLLLAELDGRIVGTLIAAWDGWRGNLYRLAVEAESRRAGIASRLVDAGEDLLRDRGARRISAIVAESEGEATALWRSAGYEHDETVARFVKNL